MLLATSQHLKMLMLSSQQPESPVHVAHYYMRQIAETRNYFKAINNASIVSINIFDLPTVFFSSHLFGSAFAV